MWHLKKIPNRLLVYFGGHKLSYLRYLTIESFIKYNPSWEVEFYYPKYPTTEHSWVSFEQKYEVKWDDYFDKIASLGVKMIKVDFEDWFDMPNKMSEVHKSDLLRWYLLNQSGGWWADMDILFFAPMEDLLINTQDNEDVDTVVCVSRYGHSIGFLASAEGNPTFATMFNQALKDYLPSQYQGIGSTLLNRVLPNIDDSNIANLGMDAVYHYDASNIAKIYSVNPSPQSVPGAVGCHWYAGHPLAGDFLSKTNGGKDKLPNNVIGNLIKNYGSSKVQRNIR